MVEGVLELFREGGYPLLFLACAVAANVAQYKDRMSIQRELVAANKESAQAQLKAIEILSRIETKVDKCTK